MQLDLGVRRSYNTPLNSRWEKHVGGHGSSTTRLLPMETVEKRTGEQLRTLVRLAREAGWQLSIRILSLDFDMLMTNSLS
jgi:hypothetical protein